MTPFSCFSAGPGDETHSSIQLVQAWARCRHNAKERLLGVWGIDNSRCCPSTLVCLGVAMTRTNN
jgi:hypothetical protein